MRNDEKYFRECPVCGEYYTPESFKACPWTKESGLRTCEEEVCYHCLSSHIGGGDHGHYLGVDEPQVLKRFAECEADENADRKMMDRRIGGN